MKGASCERSGKGGRGCTQSVWSLFAPPSSRVPLFEGPAAADFACFPHLPACRLFIGLAGLATDQQTFYEKLKFRMAMYSLREERDIKPASFGKLVSSLLYEKRFGPYFIEPVIAGLDRCVLD